MTSLEARISGAVLGAAIGDALGHPTEFLDADQIHSQYGPLGVQGYELYWDSPSGRFAPYTDDTQMAEIVLTALISVPADVDPVMKTIAGGFAAWIDQPQGGHRAPGRACLNGASRLRDGVHWSEAGGPNDGGCGSVMRAYPFGIRFWREPATAAQWAAQHSLLTHGAPIALAACAAIATGIALVMQGEESRDALSRAVEAARVFDAGTAELMAAAIDRANEAPHEVLSDLQGWAAHEAIAAAAYCVARSDGNFTTAVLLGANAPGDSDSIATLAGALVGAEAGVAGIPAGWIRDLERSAELQLLATNAAAVVADAAR